MPQEFIDSELNKVGFLVDGKDFVTDSVCYCSILNRSQFSDKMKANWLMCRENCTVSWESFRKEAG